MSFTVIGGGGGGGTGSPGRGGGSGAYVEGLIDLAKLGTVTDVLVTVAGGGQRSGGSGVGGSSGGGSVGQYGTYGAGGAGGDVGGTKQASGGGMSAITNWTGKTTTDSAFLADLIAIAGGGGGGSTTSAGANGAALGTGAGGNNDPGSWRASGTFTPAVGGDVPGDVPGIGGAGGTAGSETPGLPGENFDPQASWGNGGNGNTNSSGGAGGAGFGGGGSGQAQDGGAAGGSFVNNGLYQVVGTPTFRPSGVNDAAGRGGAKDANGQDGKVEIRFITFPGAPTDVTGVPGDGQVSVSWQAPESDGGSAITEYAVATFQVLNGQNQPVAQTCTTTGALSCEVTGLTNGSQYTFSVTAWNIVGKGAESSGSGSVVPGQPGPPINVTGVPGDGQVSVSWDAPADTGGLPIDVYTVETFEVGQSQPVAQTCTTTGDLSCVVRGLTNGVTYEFGVTASTNAATSPMSDRSAPVLLPLLPGAPTNVTGVPGDGQVSVSWDAPVDTGGLPIIAYSVQSNQSVDGQFVPAPQTCTTTGATTCVVLGLTNGVTYGFAVTASTDAGTGPESIVSAPLVPAGQPNPPTSLTAQPRNAQIELTWVDGATAGGSILDVEYTTDGGASWLTTGGIGPPAIIFTESDGTTALSNGTEYTVALRMQTSGGTSGASATVSMTPGTPQSPASGTALLNGGVAELSWDPAFGNGFDVVEYRVVVTQIAGRSGLLMSNRSGAGTYTTTSTSLAVTGLTEDSTYSFAISGRTIYGWGPALVLTRAGSGLVPHQVLPPDWHQSIGRTSADEKCPTGWSPSWAQWMNDGSGGFVCNRVIFWDSDRNVWSMRAAALSIRG